MGENSMWNGKCLDTVVFGTYVIIKEKFINIYKMKRNNHFIFSIYINVLKLEGGIIFFFFEN